MTWSSAPDAAKMESSVGCHSMDVTGAWCQLNEATGAESRPADLRNAMVRRADELKRVCGTGQSRDGKFTPSF